MTCSAAMAGSTLPQMNSLPCARAAGKPVLDYKRLDLRLHQRRPVIRTLVKTEDLIVACSGSQICMPQLPSHLNLLLTMHP